MTRFSKITIGLSIYIIISASFMLQVSKIFIETFGAENAKLIFLLLYFLIAVSYISYISYKMVPQYRTAIAILIFILTYFYILWQPYFAEEIHVVEYGILGFLALRDLLKSDEPNLKNIIFALLFVVLIGTLDEGFQYILPYRNFDPRDIATNVISGSLGIIQCLVYRYRI